MKEVRELIEKIRSVEKKEHGFRGLHDSVLMLELKIRADKDFAGEYERLSKIVAFSDILYYYLLLLDREGLSFEQMVHNLERRLSRGDTGPQMRVMPPSVSNTSSGDEQ